MANRGDIVVYVGEGNGVWAQRREMKTEYMVVREDAVQLSLVSITGEPEEIWIRPESVKVIRTVTYTEVE